MLIIKKKINKFIVYLNSSYNDIECFVLKSGVILILCILILYLN